MAGFSLKRLRAAFTNPGTQEGPAGNHRVHTRYRTFARVKIQGHMGEENLLKDLSVTGCCLECTSLADIHADTQYTLEVIPEDAAQIGRFELEVSTVWIRPAGYSGEVGFNIVASPRGKLFQRYVDYLSWREAHQPQSPAN
ncbi:MAG: PilZ domain-containing protein [Treponema sp.]|nr:PilZ domain-containing protein [Treponema sp.]